MTKFTIEQGYTNPTLRTVSSTIANHDIRKYKKIADDMIKYIKNPKNGWVWLAAPQIGINKRLIVASLMQDYDDESYRTIALINPVIIAHSEDITWDDEWCLSVPGETGEVLRYAWVEIEYLDTSWQKYRIRLDRLAARIIQHEIDHLDGILFTDRIKEQETLLVTSRKKS